MKNLTKIVVGGVLLTAASGLVGFNIGYIAGVMGSVPISAEAERDGKLWITTKQEFYHVLQCENLTERGCLLYGPLPEYADSLPVEEGFDLPKQTLAGVFRR